MGDLFYVPPKENLKECRWLEKNYISCLIQKGLRDRIPESICSENHIIYFHLECPSWIKKFEGEQGKQYIKRQIFATTWLAYVNDKANEKRNLYYNVMEPVDLAKSQQYTPYPEEIETEFNYQKDDSENKDLYRKHNQFYRDKYEFYPKEITHPIFRNIKY
jgi:hypothetical protein